jgi:hypothetical protein
MRRPGVVALVALALVAPFSSFGAEPAGARPPVQTCGSDSYINSRGHCVHRPTRADRAPAGATAKCRDGSYSFSHSRRGTCSWHGGVAQWLSGR